MTRRRIKLEFSPIPPVNIIHPGDVMRLRVRQYDGQFGEQGFNCQLRAFVTFMPGFFQNTKSEERPEIPNNPDSLFTTRSGHPGSGWFGWRPRTSHQSRITTAGTHHQAFQRRHSH